MNIAGMSGTQTIVLTASQLAAIIKPITGFIKNQAALAKTSTVNAVKGAGSTMQNFKSAAAGKGFDKEGMISTAFDDNPLMNMVGDMFGQNKETAEKEKQAAEQKAQADGAAANSLSIIDSLSDIKVLLSHILNDTTTSNIHEIAMLEEWASQAKLSEMAIEAQAGMDASERMRQIENEREAKAAGGKSKGAGKAVKVATAASGGGGLISTLGRMLMMIPGMGLVGTLFSGGMSLIKGLFGKLFWPFYLVMGVISFVDGFMAGYAEGGIGEGITQGFENLLDNLLDVPLNALKDLFSWALGALGFDEASEALDGFDFNISGIIRPIIDFFTGMWETLSAIPENLKNFAAQAAGNILPDWLNPFFIGPEEAPEPPSERGARGTDKRLKKSESPAPAPRTSKTGKREPRKEAKPTPKSKAAEEKKLSDDEMLLQDVDPSTGVPKFMLKKYKDEYIEDDDERGRVGSMYKTEMSEQIGGGKIMWDKESKLYKQDKRTDAETDLTNRIDKFNYVTPEEKEVWKTERDKENLGYAEEQLGDATDPEVKAEILQYIKELKSDMGIKTAEKIQDAGIEKGAGGGQAVIINSSPTTTVSNSNQSNPAVLAMGRNLDSDSSLNVNA